MLDWLIVTFILLLGLSPFLLQLAQGFGILPQQSRFQRRLQQRLQRRLQGYLSHPRLSGFSGLGAVSLGEEAEERYIEGIGIVIGDLSCQFNGRSPLIRCAINPLGPCAECPSYEPKAELRA